ncbi:MAG: DNA ligase [Halarcobacter sp.]
MKTIILLFCLVTYSFSQNTQLNLQSSKKYSGNESIKGWLMSEKLDGIRAYWNGKELLTRRGKRIYTPLWFIKNFPNFELDGELWTKRADFENIQNIVMDKKPSKDWREITYNIFEVPNEKGAFLQRLKKAKIWFKKNPNSQVKIIKQIKCKDAKELNLFLEKIISKKGEGVIIKDPKKDFHIGRSPHTLKVKKAFDMEGKVIGINISEKTGVLKSLVLKLKDGVIFNLGTGFTKKERITPAKIGENVTFKYYGLTKNGIPKFASFLHIRKD